LRVSKRATTLLALIIIPTVGLHSGVAGTDAAAANKVDVIKLVSPKYQGYKVRVNLDLENYRVIPIQNSKYISVKLYDGLTLKAE
jgi:hypothetical protein